MSMSETAGSSKEHRLIKTEGRLSCISKLETAAEDHGTESMSRQNLSASNKRARHCCLPSSVVHFLSFILLLLETSTAIMLRYAFSLLAAAFFLVEFAAAECLSNPEFNQFFEDAAGGEIPLEGSCCQQDVCGLPCPQTTSAPGIGECCYNKNMKYVSFSFRCILLSEYLTPLFVDTS